MRIGRTLPWCAVILLTGCHVDSREPSIAAVVADPARSQTAAAVKMGPTPQELTVGMVEAATMGNSDLPVAIRFDLLQRPTVGKPIELVVALMPQIAAAPVTIHIRGSEGVTLAASEGDISMEQVEASGVYRHTIKLTPSGDGIQMIALDVTMKHDDTIENRVFSVPLIVAESTDGSLTGKR